MKATLRKLAGLLMAVVPLASFAEGSRELTPNNSGTTADLTSASNTRAGYLMHDSNSPRLVSRGFLKPSSWNGGTFSEDHRMYIRLKAGETLYYGVHRTYNGKTISSRRPDNRQDNLLLTLRYGTGAGTIAKISKLFRDSTTSSSSAANYNQYALLTNSGLLNLEQPGVIATAAQNQAGPRSLTNLGGYPALSYTNNTGADRDFYVEFTQGNYRAQGDANMNDDQLLSYYDFWDFTVKNSSGQEQKGRLFSKYWSFTSGSSGGTGYENRLSSQFALYTLIGSVQNPGKYYVKEFELAGMRPLDFYFVANANGASAAAGSTFAQRRKSQTSDLGYPEYPNFVNDPDPSIWPSAPIPNFARTYQPFCNTVLNRGSAAFTTVSEETGSVNILVDLNNNGIKDGNDVLIEQLVTTANVPVTTLWNGLNAAGGTVPTGTVIKLSFTSTGAPVNFPIFDAEGNPDGFRVQNVRPSSGGNAYYDRLYWDDSNLSTNLFPTVPNATDGSNVRLDGVVSTSGVHRWGDATNTAGDGYLVNTWTYGFISTASEQTYTYTYNCDFDGDGISDANDIDDDNDGIPDTAESFGVNPQTYSLNGVVKTDGTGVPIYLDGGYVVSGRGAWRDVNADGLNDWFDADLDGIPNHYDTDSDGDGLADAIEANNGKPVTNFVASSGRLSGAVSPGGAGRGMPTIAQTGTNNGVSIFTLLDHDGDGVLDLYDADSDNDGNPDLFEVQSSIAAPAGRFAPGNGAAFRAPIYVATTVNGVTRLIDKDTDEDGINDAFDSDNGGTGLLYAWNTGTNPNTAPGSALTLPDYLDLDSDNDGLPDGFENNNGGNYFGNMDSNGHFTLPNLQDANRDGFDDRAYAQVFPSGGLFNPTKGLVADRDLENVPNYRDLDSDNDGIPDMLEGNDGRLLPGASYEGRFLPADALANDSDADGLVNIVDPDTGYLNLIYTNTDADALPNYLDKDSDNDGIPDMREALLGVLIDANVDAEGQVVAGAFPASDNDGDGHYDAVDPNSAAGAAFANPATNQQRMILDTDGDGRMDYLDIDSDNDGILDNREGQLTVNYFAPSGVDTDGDGVDDSYDINGANRGFTPYNWDGDAFMDYRDPNTDADAFMDWTEGFDDNHNGYAIDDLKAKAAALATRYPSYAGYYPLTGIATNAPADWMLDADNDGIPNFLDPVGANGNFYHDDNRNGLVDLFDPAFGNSPSTAPRRTTGQEDADYRFQGALVPLPVELVEFTAQAARPDALLSWATAQEKNNAYFTVERSLDGGNSFEAAGQVTGQGTTTRRTAYRFVDKNVALKGRSTVYYRLRQVDLDGTATTSDVRAVTFEATAGGLAGVYPNPATAASQVDLTKLPVGAPCQLSILTADGKLVRRFEALGGTLVPLAADALPAGAYLLQVKSATLPTQVLKFTKN